MPDDSVPNHPKSELTFFYEKSKMFRVIHVDGAHGMISPSGRGITMSLFSERKTIPRQQVFAVSEDGKIKPEPIHVEDRDGVFREIEVCACMDILVAKAIHEWLGRQIDIHGAIINANQRDRESIQP